MKRENKWYENRQFPVLPIFEKDKGKMFPDSYSFLWLFIRIWTINTFVIDFTITLFSYEGLQIKIILPYLALSFNIPFTNNFYYWIDEKLTKRK